MAEPLRFHVPSVPPFHSKEVEQRNTNGLQRNGARNKGGTTDLQTLAKQALLRLASGTASGTRAEHTPVNSVPPPGTAADLLSDGGYPVCPHVDDVELACWYAENPKVVCARCWLERHR
jgi:hypothetical protein